MVDQIITLRLTANSTGMVTEVRKVSKDIADMGAKAEQAGAQTEAGFSRARRGLVSISAQLGQARTALLGYIGASQAINLARNLEAMASGWANLSARLKLATGSAAEYAVAQSDVFRIAQLTSTSLEVTATLYGRMASSLRDAGASQAELSTITQTVNQALIVSGATASEASSAITQLSQAMASGVLRGEEFNSVNEAAPRLMQALASSIGVTRGELRKMAEDGEITADVMRRALVDEAGKIAQEAAQIPLTIERAWVQLENAMTRYVGQADQASGVSSSLANAIADLANNLDDVERAVVGVAEVLVVLAGARGLGGAVAGFVALREAMAAAALWSAWTGAAGTAALAADKLGARLIALAGGPVVVAATAIGLLAIEVKKTWDAIIEAEQRGATSIAMASGSIGQALANSSRSVASIEQDVARLSDLMYRDRGRPQAIERYNESLASLQAQFLKAGGTAVEWSELLSRSTSAAAAARSGASQLGAAMVRLNAISEAAGLAQGRQAKAAVELAERLRQLDLEERRTPQLIDEINQQRQALIEQYQKQSAVMGGVTEATKANEVSTRTAADAALVAAVDTHAFADAMGAAQQASGDLSSILDDQAAQLGGDSVRAALTYRDTLVRIFDAEMALMALGPMTVEQQAKIDLARRLSAQVYADAQAGTREEITETERAAMDAADNSSRAWTDFAGDLVDAMGHGMRGVKDLFKRMLADLVRQLLQSQILKLMASTFGASMPGLAAAAGASGQQSQLGAMLGGGGGVGGMNFGNLLGGITQGGGIVGGINTSLFGAAGVGGLLAGVGGAVGAFGAGMTVAGSAGMVAATQFGAASLAAGNLAVGLGAMVPVIGWVVAAAALLYQAFGDEQETILRVRSQQFNGPRQARGVAESNLGSIFVRGESLGDGAAVEAANRIMEFDNLIAGFLTADQLAAVRERLSNVNDTFRDGAATIGEALSARLSAILGELSTDVQAFVGTAGELEDRVGRLAEALQIESLVGLGGIGDTFAEVAGLIEEYRVGTEEIGATYNRLVAGTQLFEAALDMAGIAFDGTRRELIAFTADITEAAGGLDRAQALWQSYFNTFYTAEERGQYALDQANANAGTQFGDIGLNAGDYTGAGGAQAFRELFESLLPTLSAAAVVEWLEAADALGVVINLSGQMGDELVAVLRDAEGMASLLSDLRWDDALAGMSEYERALAEANRAFDESTAAARAMGATSAELAEIDNLRANALDRIAGAEQTRLDEEDAARLAELGSLLGGLSWDEATAGMTEYARAVAETNRAFDESRESAVDLRASSADLARIEDLRASALDRLLVAENDRLAAQEAQLNGILGGLSLESAAAGMTEYQRAIAQTGRSFDAARASATELHASNEQLAQIEGFRADALDRLAQSEQDRLDREAADRAGQLGSLMAGLRWDDAAASMNEAEQAITQINRAFDEARVSAVALGAAEADALEIEALRTAALGRLAEAAQRQRDEEDAARREQLGGLMGGLRWDEATAGMNDAERAITQVNRAFDEARQSAAALGAAEADALEIENLRTAALERLTAAATQRQAEEDAARREQLGSLMGGLRWDDAAAGMNEAERAITQVNRAFDEARASAAALGAAEADALEIEDLRMAALGRLTAAATQRQAEEDAARREQLGGLLGGLRWDNTLAGMTAYEQSIAQLNRSFDEARQSAAALGAAEADALEIEELRTAALGRLAAAEEEERVTQLGDLMGGLRWDDLSAGLTDYQRALAETDRSFAAARASAIELHASTAQLAEIEALRANALDRLAAAEDARLVEAMGAYTDMVRDLNDELADVRGLSEFQQEMRSVSRWLDDTTAALNDAARAAGMQRASELDLATAHEIAAARAAAAIAQLTERGRDVVGELYGSPLEQLNAQIAAIEAGISGFAGGVSGGMEQVTQATDNAIQAQLGAQQRISDWLDNLLIGDLGGLRPRDALVEAQNLFDETLAAALGGDAEAMAALPGLADQLLRLGQTVYASGDPYFDLRDSIIEAMQQALAIGAGAGTPGGGFDPTGGGGNLGGGGGGSYGLDPGLISERDRLVAEQAAAQRRELALELAGIVRDLVIATGDPLVEIADRLGFGMEALITDLGVNLNDLTVGTAGQLADIAQATGTNLSELAASVGTDLGALGDRQSLLNDALESEIAALPQGQRDLLAPLLRDVEEAAALGDTAGVETGIEAMEGAINDLSPDIRDALAPYFLQVIPASPATQIQHLSNMDGALGTIRDGIANSLTELQAHTASLGAIANSVGGLQPGTLGGGTIGPLLPSGDNFVVEVGELLKRSGTNSDAGNLLVTELQELRRERREADEYTKRLERRLEQLEATTRAGDDAKIRAMDRQNDTLKSRK